MLLNSEQQDNLNAALLNLKAKSRNHTIKLIVNALSLEDKESIAEAIATLFYYQSRDNNGRAITTQEATERFFLGTHKRGNTTTFLFTKNTLAKKRNLVDTSMKLIII